jgi:hypothetical protein
VTERFASIGGTEAFIHTSRASVAIGAGLAGCGPIGWIRVTTNHPLDALAVAFVVSSRTTRADVTSRLGAPNEIAAARDGLVADYVYSDAKSFRINFGWPLGFVTPVSYAPHDLALGGQGIEVGTFEVAFDARGVVRDADFRRGNAASRYRLWPFETPSR